MKFGQDALAANPGSKLNDPGDTVGITHDIGTPAEKKLLAEAAAVASAAVNVMTAEPGKVSTPPEHAPYAPNDPGVTIDRTLGRPGGAATLASAPSGPTVFYDPSSPRGSKIVAQDRHLRGIPTQDARVADGLGGALGAALGFAFFGIPGALIAGALGYAAAREWTGPNRLVMVEKRFVLAPGERKTVVRSGSWRTGFNRLYVQAASQTPHALNASAGNASMRTAWPSWDPSALDRFVILQPSDETVVLTNASGSTPATVQLYWGNASTV